MRAIRFPARLRQRRQSSAAGAFAPRQSVAAAVLKFALTGFVALAVLAFFAVHILQSRGQDEAIANAKHETQLAGEGIVVPALDPGILKGRPGAIARLDRLVRRHVLRESVVRVKIWTGQGRILYSDKHQLIGTGYTLGEDELAALRSRGVDAEVSDLSKPENRFERRYGKLLEVYLGIRGPGGKPLLYEEYLKYSSVAASANRLLESFTPPFLVALLALELTQIPLAWSLARRLRSGQDEREALLRRSIEASDVERRRIASDLHDGVVQSLAGVSYSLSAAAEHIPAGLVPAAAQLVDQAAADTRQSIRELRTLLVEIYPPTLQREGLGPALSDLLARLEAHEVETELDLAADLELPADSAQVLYRVAQEALRNVASHANATHVRVSAARHNGRAILSVQDDGRGFDPGKDGAETSGHFGLRIMRDLARDARGVLTIDAAPGAGTTVRLELPVR